MHLTKELFVFENGENYIIFAPLQRTILEVNPATVSLLKECGKSGYFPDGETKDILEKAGILSKELPHEKCVSNTAGGAYLPTTVTLFPTSDCNLRCRYCYASAGEKKNKLNIRAAKSAIDLIINNALKTGKKEISVSFHGGGEPFFGYAWTLVHEIVGYAQELAAKHSVKAKFFSGSNGVLSMTQLEWIVKNMHSLTISLDGPPDIHNSQRPFASGEGSYEYVLRTIKFFEEHKMGYGIRSTITSESCGRLTEIAEHFRSISSLKKFHLEPLWEVGRCSTTKLKSPDYAFFAKMFVEAQKAVAPYGISLYYSSGDCDKVTDKFCGASRGNFCVTPAGDVTSCYEVNDISDPRSKLFFFGEYNSEENIYQFDMNRLEYLRARKVTALSNCSDCFIKYQCAGDCPAKCATLGDLFDTSANPRCEASRLIALSSLKSRLKPLKGGVHETAG
jgi:uncharacterized protein